MYIDPDFLKAAKERAEKELTDLVEAYAAGADVTLEQIAKANDGLSVIEFLGIDTDTETETDNDSEEVEDA